ncbi:MAG: DUF736 family protein [Alphaproteobacteria bacterium]|nr:DUF736 family protein [Alphaproteobacteria bacterium]
MKIIGCFRKDGSEWIGTIAVLQFEAKARIVANSAKTSSDMPDFLFEKIGSTGDFKVILGAAWDRYSAQQRTHYKEVSIDDPSMAHSIKCILWENPDDDCWYLYWDRNATGQHMIEKLYVQEELKPQLGIRPVTRITQNMLLFYPDLVPG